MSLSNALRKLDDWEAYDVFDESTGCRMERNASGDIELTMEDGIDSVSDTLENLLRGPCAGYRGKALDRRVKEVMTRRLRDEVARNLEEIEVEA